MARRSYLCLLTLNTVAFLFLGAQPSRAQIEYWHEVYETSDSLPFCTIQNIWFLSDSVGFMGGLCPHTLWQTFDGGVSWIPRWDLGSEGLSNVEEIQFVSDSQGFAKNENALALTFDAGETWEFLQAPQEVRLGEIIYTNPSRLLSVAQWSTDWGNPPIYWYSQLSQSLDSGHTWSVLQEFDFGENSYGLGYAVQSASGTLLMPGGGFSPIKHIWRSTDGGYSWDTTRLPILARFGGIGSPSAEKFFIFGQKINASGEYYPAIIGSTDDGVSWEQVWEDSLYGSDYYPGNVVFSDSLHGWGYSSQGMFLQTDDGGETWFAYEMDLSGPIGGYLIVDHVYAKQDLGWAVALGVQVPSKLFRFERPVAMGPLLNRSLPLDIRLSVYPNPFNPTMNIVFAASSVGKLEITVFDVLGRGVWKAGGYLGPSGEFQTTWTPREISSGRYFISISLNKKLVCSQGITFCK